MCGSFAIVDDRHTFIYFAEEQPGLKITLESAQACFLSNDRMVLSLHGGELYVLSLMADSMRSVRGFHFEKAAASVLTTCVSVLVTYFIFFFFITNNSKCGMKWTK